MADRPRFRAADRSASAAWRAPRVVRAGVAAAGLHRLCRLGIAAAVTAHRSTRAGNRGTAGSGTTAGLCAADSRRHTGRGAAARRGAGCAGPRHRPGTRRGDCVGRAVFRSATGRRHRDPGNQHLRPCKHPRRCQCAGADHPSPAPQRPGSTAAQHRWNTPRGVWGAHALFALPLHGATVRRGGMGRPPAVRAVQGDRPSRLTTGRRLTGAPQRRCEDRP